MARTERSHFGPSVKSDLCIAPDALPSLRLCRSSTVKLGDLSARRQLDRLPRIAACRPAAQHPRQAIG